MTRAETDSAVRACAQLVGGGGGDVIAAQAVRYVAPETWNALVERHRGKGCDALAAFARVLLDGKKSLHGVVGSLVGALLAALGRPRIEQVFAQELARRVPLPFGHETALAARGLQAAGIFICFTDTGTMNDCACLRDLLLNEGKAQLDNLLQGALNDWSRLPGRMQPATAEPEYR
ncbi:hypothetical protein [Kitasatospora sp. NPDC088783]|uniref:hypothetical protein n=1 Tax=Kitasatospora sp. NPDC088783 TaxID=3364077 RepID=UPI00380081A5